MKIKISRKQWEKVGKMSGWQPADLGAMTDRDLPPALTPQDEEDALLGPDDPYDKDLSYKEGYHAGLSAHMEDMDNPYRTDTESGIKRFDEWREGFRDARSKKPSRVRLEAKTSKRMQIKVSKSQWESIGTKTGWKTAQNLEIVKTPEGFTDRELTRAIRDAIIAEEGAIKQYESVVDATDNEKAKKVLQSVADEERVHVGELQTLLNELLPDEKKHLEEGKKEVEDKD